MTIGIAVIIGLLLFIAVDLGWISEMIWGRAKKFSTVDEITKKASDEHVHQYVPAESNLYDELIKPGIMSEINPLKKKADELSAMKKGISQMVERLNKAEKDVKGVFEDIQCLQAAERPPLDMFKRLNDIEGKTDILMMNYLGLKNKKKGAKS